MSTKPTEQKKPTAAQSAAALLKQINAYEDAVNSSSTASRALFCTAAWPYLMGMMTHLATDGTETEKRACLASLRRICDAAAYGHNRALGIRES